MQRIYCYTNLKLKQEQWPEVLPASPSVGDEIQSKTKHGSFRLSLTVVKVRWIFCERSNEWIQGVELHDAKNRSIREFYKWYAPLVDESVSSFI